MLLCEPLHIWHDSCDLCGFNRLRSNKSLNNRQFWGKKKNEHQIEARILIEQKIDERNCVFCF